MSDKLALVDDLTAIQIASICDHSILETYTSFLAKGEESKTIKEQNLLDFLEGDDTERACAVCNLCASGMRSNTR